MKNGSNGINILEQQMANNEDICCSCGIIDSFPKVFFDNYQIADVGIIVCTSGKFTIRCEDVEYGLSYYSWGFNICHKSVSLRYATQTSRL